MKYFLPILLSTLASAQAQTLPMTLTGDIGKPVTFQSTPSRVIAIGAENAEMLSVLGVKPVGFAILKADLAVGNKVGRSFDMLGADVLKDATYIGLSKEPSKELLLSLKPDLVLMYGAERAREPYNSVARLAPSLAYDFDTQHTWKGPLKDLSRLFGKQQKANQFISRFDREAARLKRQMPARVRAKPNTTFLYMPNASTIMLLGNKFAFGKSLKALGMKINTPPGKSANFMAEPITPEALLNYKHDRVVVLGLDGFQKNTPAQVVFEQLEKQGVPIFTYKMPPYQPYSGPLTDLARMQDMSKLITQ